MKTSPVGAGEPLFSAPEAPLKIAASIAMARRT
jgi:hypothetical protein